jgi:signal transduction histidine kinase
MVLATMLTAVATSEVLNGLCLSLGATSTSLLCARCALLLGMAAGAVNLHFLVIHCRQPSLVWVYKTGYVCTALFAGAVLLSMLGQLSSVESLVYPQGFSSVSEGLAYALLLLLVAFHLGYLWISGRAAIQRVRGAAAIAIWALLLAPITSTDIFLTYRGHGKLFLAEASTWAYALVVLSRLLSEIQGTEGLLQKTTSSLAARTKELESSYAELDLMQSELSRKQQLAAVGELAAAIAHEVRNPLAIIMNAVSGMKRPSVSEKDRGILLSIVNEEAERLNQLVAELLRFARPVNASRSAASLLDICERAAQNPPDGITVLVKTEPGDGLDPVLVDPGLFRLALDNLLANSRQALKEGGEIQLSVHKGEFSDGTRAAVVDIIDAGCGMKQEELENARKPFFTTKPRGTGLGIPIVDRIVEAHGGEMHIESRVGIGTTVTIKLPFEGEFARTSAIPGSLSPNSRRRLRSVPPSSRPAELRSGVSVADGVAESEISSGTRDQRENEPAS